MSNRELPMMPWYPDQFDAATKGWTFIERAAYRALLDAQWQLGSLPQEQNRLCLTIGMRARDFGRVWLRLVEKFPVVGGVRQNSRLEQHRLAALSLKKAKSEGGRIGNAKRWHSESDTSSDSNRSAIGQRSPLSPSPSPSLKEEEHPPTPLKGGDFGNGERKPRETRNGSLRTWRTLIPLVDHVRSTAGLKDALTWRYVQERVDPIVWQAVERMGGCLPIAERDRFTTSELEARFREAYENLFEREARA